jgi:hypothetical protein
LPTVTNVYAVYSSNLQPFVRGLNGRLLQICWIILDGGIFVAMVFCLRRFQKRGRSPLYSRILSTDSVSPAEMILPAETPRKTSSVTRLRLRMKALFVEGSQAERMQPMNNWN